MSNKLFKKAARVIIAEIVCLILLGGFLGAMQIRLSVRNQMENTGEKLRQIPEIVSSANETAEQNRMSYDEIYQSKAESVAYMAKRDAGFTGTDAQLKQLADMMNVNNILLVDQSGRVAAQAAPTQADFTYARFNQLRTVFRDGKPSEAFNVTIDGVTRRYYGARIEELTQEVVIEQDPEELVRIQDDISSWKSMFSNVNVGLNGYTFVVSSQDYTFLYHPDETLTGQDSLAAGLKVEDLEDGNYAWMKVNGRQFYCGVKFLDAENAYVICAVPAAELISSSIITVAVVLFIFFVVVTVVVFYAFLLLKEPEEEDDRVSLGRLSFHKTVGRKVGTICVVGLLSVLMVSFYMQTLFSLSMRSMSNKRQVQDVEETLQRNQQDVETLTEQYNRRYLNKGQVASRILSGNRQLWNRDDLAELSRVLDVEFVMIFDKDGREAASDSNYINFTLSDNPEDQSYEFNQLLQGVEYVVQKPMPDDISGKLHQYIGVLLYDAQGSPDGFVQISLVPEKLEEALAATKLSAVLDGVKPSAGGFAFAVNKDDQTFSWYPDERLAGRSAVSYGMDGDEFHDGYSDYVTVNGQKYYGSGVETDTDYVYVVVPDDRLYPTRIPVSLASAGASLVFLGLIWLMLAAGVNGKKPGEAGGGEEGPMIDVKLPDGRVGKTESAASRWANSSIKWDDRTPEQQMASVLKGMMSLLALVICLAVLFKDKFFGDDSIFLYVLNGGWERGVNIFAITGCIMIICVAGTAVMAVREILRMLSKTFGARGETVCRMLRSFIKYVSFIAVLYYCFALFGVDTKTLLASAGILSLVIGLGAKTLVSDILAGLFIIFEGEFRVGDIVTVGDWRGTVQEIGVRTTKIMDAGQNVKIISNSDVSGVINMTRRNSYTSCDVGIEYGESLERVESILARELTNIKKRLPAIKDGPFYKGVVSLGDNSVNIRIVAQCAESDRMQLARDLNREMKLLFDKYDINIPFPQVVLNQPKDYVKATASEKRRADEFNQEQKELSKELKQEDGEKN